MTIKVVNEIIPVEVQVKPRRTLKMQLRSDKTLLIVSPMKLSEAKVQKILTEHYGWVEKQVERFNMIQPQEGYLLYQGDFYPIVNQTISVGTRKISLKQSDLLFDTTRLFYRIGEKLNLKLALVYRKYRAAWGKFYRKDARIGLTHRMYVLPLELQAYLIYHEYCHYFYPGHGKDFYEKLSNYVPNHKALRFELNRYNYFLENH